MAEETENKEQSEQSVTPASASSGEPAPDGDEQGKQTPQAQHAQSPVPNEGLAEETTVTAGDGEGSEKSRSASRFVFKRIRKIK